MLKIENLKKDLIIDNYKKLCELVGVEPKSRGNSRNAQMKEFKQYFDFEKVEGSQKIRILEVFDTIDEKIDKRKLKTKKGNNRGYGNMIDFLILDLIVQNNFDDNNIYKKSRLCLPLNTLLRRTQIVSNNYLEGRKNIAKLSEITEINKHMIYDFYKNYNKEYRNKIESALTSLDNRAVIDFQIVTMIRTIETINDIDINLKGKKVGVNSNTAVSNSRIAEPHERLLIKRTEKKVLKEMGFTSRSEVEGNRKWKKFITRVEEILWEYNLNEENKKMLLSEVKEYDKALKQIKNEKSLVAIEEEKKKTLKMIELIPNTTEKLDYYYKAYDLVYDYENVKEEYDKMDYTKNSAITELNGKMCNRLAKINYNNHKNSIKKANAGKELYINEREHIKDEYEKLGGKFISEVVSVHANDITKEFKYTQYKFDVEDSNNGDIPF